MREEGEESEDTAGKFVGRGRVICHFSRCSVCFPLRGEKFSCLLLLMSLTMHRPRNFPEQVALVSHFRLKFL